MFGKLRQRYLQRENVLIRCYDDPEILEKFLEDHRARRCFGVFAPLAVIVIALGFYFFRSTDWDAEFGLMVVFMALITDRIQQSELHRVQSLRLMQHVRSQE